MVIDLIFDTHFDEVRIDGNTFDPGPSQEHVNYSPDGFAWGYGGAGPTQLAYAILFRHDPDTAANFCLQFKEEIVAEWPQPGGRFRLNLDGWLYAARLERHIRDTYKSYAEADLLAWLLDYRRRCSTPTPATERTARA